MKRQERVGFKLRRHLGVATTTEPPANQPLGVSQSVTCSRCHGESSKDLTQFMKIRFRSFLCVCAVPKQNIWFCFALHFSAVRSGKKIKENHQQARRGVSRITLAIWRACERVASRLSLLHPFSPPPHLAHPLWQVGIGVGVTLFLSHLPQQGAATGRPVTLTGLMNNSLIMRVSHS